MSRIYRSVIFPAYQTLKKSTVLSRLHDLTESQWLGTTEIEQLQARKLNTLLRYTFEHVPWYRQFESDPTGSDLDSFQWLAELPELNKDIIRKDLDKLVSESLANNSIIKNQTSGSTGEASYFYTDLWSSDARKAAVIRNKEWMGITNGEKEVRLWGASQDDPASQKLREKLHSFITRSKFLSSYNMRPEDMDRYIKDIQSFRPSLLITYPGPGEVFAEYCSSVGAHFPSLRAVVTSAEMLWEHQRESIQAGLETPVFNRYGCREVGDIAHECPYGTMHINAERIFVEAVREDGSQCEDGEIGELLVTDLDNFGMPFIRYRIGDQGAIVRQVECECGRKLPALSQLEGRSLDIIRTPNGNAVGGTFWTILFKTRPGIRQFQIRQTALDHISVYYVPESTDISDAAMSHFKQAIGERCGPKMKIQFEPVSGIEETNSGKRRIIISEISQ